MSTVAPPTSRETAAFAMEKPSGRPASVPLMVQPSEPTFVNFARSLRLLTSMAHGTDTVRPAFVEETPSDTVTLALYGPQLVATYACCAVFRGDGSLIAPSPKNH